MERSGEHGGRGRGGRGGRVRKRDRNKGLGEGRRVRWVGREVKTWGWRV